jgi:hypothetical protein
MESARRIQHSSGCVGWQWPGAKSRTPVQTQYNAEMEKSDDGSFHASFDTKVCEPGPLFASVRTESPSAGFDTMVTIIANAANPDP